MNNFKLLAPIALLAVILLLLWPSPPTADADHGGLPQIPPSQECIDLMTPEVALNLSKRMDNQAAINASWQKSVTAGCLPHNPLLYWPTEYMDWDLCLQLEGQVQTYLDSLSSWAAPHWASFQRINQRARRILGPVRRAIESAHYSGRKAQVKKLLAKERRLLAPLRRQYIAVGRKTVSRAAPIQAAGALVISDMQVRGCELGTAFIARQDTYYMITFAAIPLWLKKYSGRITERNWEVWTGWTHYAYWNNMEPMWSTNLKYL